MPTQDDDIKFTATDIEKYHRGQLSAKEMHALEKAALEDPFLAEALEGYRTSKVNAQADLAMLNKQLAERVKGGKVIALAPGTNNKRLGWKIAAAIVVLAGAGLLTYQFAFNTGSHKLAINKDEAKQETDRAADSTPVVSQPPGTTGKLEADTIRSEATSPSRKTTIRADESVKKDAANELKPSKPVVTEEKNAGITTEEESKKAKEDLAATTNQNEIRKEAPLPQDKQRVEMKRAKKEPATVPATTTNNSSILDNTAAAQNNLANNFRGRVMDANNRPVPFANIQNRYDTTYADANGFFNFASPDSVTSVQVRSVGFENNQALLRNATSDNRIILQEDRKNLPEVVLNKNAAATNRTRDDIIKAEEPEPADGWENYKAYLVNNLAVPQEIKSINLTGEVQVSFDVNKRGDPVNIKVDKSLCTKCDEEAVRLVKQGPKWKRKAKTKKASVIVSF